MKRILVLAIAAMMVFLMIGCSSGENNITCAQTGKMSLIKHDIEQVQKGDIILCATHVWLVGRRVAGAGEIAAYYNNGSPLQFPMPELIAAEAIRVVHTDDPGYSALLMVWITGSGEKIQECLNCHN